MSLGFGRGDTSEKKNGGGGSGKDLSWPLLGGKPYKETFLVSPDRSGKGTLKFSKTWST